MTVTGTGTGTGAGIGSSDRKLEIIRKRERLEELRRARAMRAETASQTTHLPSTTLYSTSRQEVEELVASLIGPVGTSLARPPPLDVVADFATQTGFDAAAGMAPQTPAAAAAAAAANIAASTPVLRFSLDRTLQAAGFDHATTTSDDADE
eukprot:jgi/Hompol1/6542/HPOL_005017-RA